MTVTIRRLKKCTSKRKCELKYGPFAYRYRCDHQVKFCRQDAAGPVLPSHHPWIRSPSAASRKSADCAEASLPAWLQSRLPALAGAK